MAYNRQQSFPELYGAYLQAARGLFLMPVCNNYVMCDYVGFPWFVHKKKGRRVKGIAKALRAIRKKGFYSNQVTLGDLGSGFKNDNAPNSV